jgi:uncharacterized protein
LNYPHLCSLFEELDVHGIDTAMGFSVSTNNKQFEWCSDSLSGLLATPRNILNPQFYLMLSDIFRFNREANNLLAMPVDEKLKQQTVREFLLAHRLSESFTNNYLIPMTAAIWSASSYDMLNFPILTLLTFLNK